MRVFSPILAGVLAVSSTAAAQDVAPENGALDGHGFSPAPVDGDVRDPLVVHRIGGWSPRQGYVHGLLEFADAPLVWCAQHYGESDCLVEEHLLDDVFALNLNGGYAPTERLRFYAVAPLFLSTDSDYHRGGGGFGDFRIGGQAAVFRDGPVQLGVVPWLDLPTGDETRYLGDTGLSGGAAVAGSVELGPLTLSTDVGAEFAPANVFEVDGADNLLVGLAAGYLPTDDWGLTVETRVTPRFLSNPVPGRGAPSELTYSVRHKRSDGVHFQLGAAHAITAGPRAARYRLFFGLGWTSTSAYDIDGDGIVHELDACPREAEVFNDWLDEDGCPEEPIFFDVVAYLDGEPVKGAELEMFGAVPNVQPGSFVGSPGRPIHVNARYGGCLLGSADAEVLPNMEPVPVELKVEHGTLRLSVTHNDGTPVTNARVLWVSDDPGSECHPQGEVVLGPHGRLTTVVGAAKQTYVVEAPGLGARVLTTDVAPRDATLVEIVMGPARAKMTSKAIALSENIWFDYNSAVVHDDSERLIEEVAAILLAHPEVTRVKVVGHTDDQGGPAFNKVLSTRRADAVIARLVEHGVDPSRLDAVGMGDTQPVATNSTARGRAKNRRVEFLVEVRQ
jgi:outer membrane protein OmpA-like peptidoglycan-associated protein